MHIRFWLIGLLLNGIGWCTLSADELSAPQRHRALLTIAQAKLALDANPQDRTALAALAEAYVTLEVRTEANHSITQLEKIAPQDPRLDQWRERLSTVPFDASDMVTSLVSESIKALEANDAAAAKDLLQVAELLAPSVYSMGVFGPGSIRVMRGDSLAEKGHFDLARADYESAKGLDEEMTDEARVALGRMLVNTGDFAAALPVLAAVSAESKDYFAFAQYWTAKALAARHEKTRALADLVQAYQLYTDLADNDPRDEDYPRERDALRAQATPEERTHLRPSSRTALAAAELLIDKGQNERARERLDAMLLRNPRNAQAYALRARIGDGSIEANERDRAIAAALSDPPNSPEAANDDPLARADLAVQLRPYASDPYIQRARLRLEQEKRESTRLALQDAREAVSLDPFDPQAWVVLAEAQIAGNNHIKISELELRKQNQTEALASADQAVALAPEDTGLLQWRGDFAAEHGAEILQRFARAMRFYTQALRLDPTSTTLLLRRARAAERADREAEAIADYRAILRLEPGATIAAYELGMNQLSLGRFADAIDTFETLQSEFPLLSGDTSPESSEIAQLIIVARAGRGEDCVAEAQQLLIRAAWRATQMFFYPTSGNANRTRHNWTVSRNCAVRPRKRRLGRVWAECPHPAGHEQRNPKSTRRRHPVHKSAR